MVNDEAREREQGADPAPQDLAHARGEQDVAAALAEGLRMVVGKDRAALSAALDRFATVLERDDTFADLRFDDGAFARAVIRIGRARGATGRAHLFRSAIMELADRETLQRLRDHLMRGMTTSSSALDGEAIAAALFCLDPVLAPTPLPARESPTLEIIFNNQLEAWNRRGLAASSGATAPPRT